MVIFSSPAPMSEVCMDTKRHIRQWLLIASVSILALDQHVLQPKSSALRNMLPCGKFGMVFYVALPSHLLVSVILRIFKIVIIKNKDHDDLYAVRNLSYWLNVKLKVFFIMNCIGIM